MLSDLALIGSVLISSPTPSTSTTSASLYLLTVLAHSVTCTQNTSNRIHSLESPATKAGFSTDTRMRGLLYLLNLHKYVLLLTKGLTNPFNTPQKGFLNYLFSQHCDSIIIISEAFLDCQTNVKSIGYSILSNSSGILTELF